MIITLGKVEISNGDHIKKEISDSCVLAIITPWIKLQIS
jgi:hypothetical protein